MEPEKQLMIDYSPLTPGGAVLGVHGPYWFAGGWAQGLRFIVATIWGGSSGSVTDPAINIPLLKEDGVP